MSDDTKSSEGDAPWWLAVRGANIPAPTIPVGENWHAESDRLAFWLIASVPLGFLLAIALYGLVLLAG